MSTFACFSILRCISEVLNWMLESLQRKQVRMFHLHHIFNKKMNKCRIKAITSKQYLWLFPFTFSRAQHIFVFISYSHSEYSIFTEAVIRKKKKKRKQDKESHLFCALLHPLSSVKVRENSSNWLNVTPPSTSAKLQRRALPERKADIQWVLSSHYFLVVYYPLQTEDTRHNLEWLWGNSYLLWVQSDCNHSYEAETCPWIPKAPASWSKKNRA